MSSGKDGEDKQKSNVQPQKLTLTPNPSLIEPYEPQLILPLSPSFVRPILNPPKKVILKPQILITKPKINPCDFYQHRDRVKPFIKQENNASGSHPVYTVKERGSELLILFSNGQWMSPWFVRVTCEGRYFHHILFLNFSNMLVETELDIYQEYVPANISKKVIINEWKKNISQHSEYLPQVISQSNKYQKFKSHIPYKLESGVDWTIVMKRTMLSTPKTMTLPNLLLLRGMSTERLIGFETDPFLSFYVSALRDDFTPVCLW